MKFCLHRPAGPQEKLYAKTAETATGIACNGDCLGAARGSVNCGAIGIAEGAARGNRDCGASGIAEPPQLGNLRCGAITIAGGPQGCNHRCMQAGLPR
jgi:hypothetical protein